ncbi:hypothetical protein ACS0TY_008235 [Phlomoides rotata]
MTRKKVTLAYITNDSERRASFRKRKKGLIKKVSELSTLCGVDACAIIYSQFDPVPEVWPSVQGAQAVLARFRRMSAMDQTRKMVNQESFTRQRIKKAEDQLRRLRKENKRKEMERFMFMNLYDMASLDQFDINDGADLGFVINQTLNEIRSQMEVVKRNERVQPPPQNYGFPAEQQPVMNVEELEGFPWDLVQSPAFGGLNDGRLGWDNRVAPPPAYTYSYMFNNGASTSGTQPGNGGSFNFLN